ncbi:uncharacterized protein LOC128871863 [Anastrepha ludens]|uniref:uncharacterized protein LOC128871863 n=1 Tax=Anastrepha ludens TaxID=28586 RepID=UPI0023AF6808|nr:uncharacterized protein LOC128871863 [Anastrepha ludens]
MKNVEITNKKNKSKSVIESKMHTCMNLKRKTSQQCASEISIVPSSRNLFPDIYDNCHEYEHETKFLGQNKSAASRSLKTRMRLRHRNDKNRINKYKFSKYRQRPIVPKSRNTTYNIDTADQMENIQFFAKKSWPNICSTLNNEAPISASLQSLNEESKIFDEKWRQAHKGNSEIFQNYSNLTDAIKQINPNQCPRKRLQQILKNKISQDFSKYNFGQPNSKNVYSTNNLLKQRETSWISNEIKSRKKGNKDVEYSRFKENHAFSPCEILKCINAEKFEANNNSLNSGDSNSNYREYSSPPATEDISVKLHKQQPYKYHPQRLLLERITNDPHLNINDKLKIIKVINPHDEETETKLKNFLQAVKLSPLVSLPADTIDLQGIVEGPKHKRSFIFFDSITIQNILNDNDNDYNFGAVEYPNSISESKSQYLDEDVRPCNSCGGKNKKPPGKSARKVAPIDNECNCEKQKNECSCAFKKLPRSVCDTWYSVFNMSAPLPFLTTKLRIFRKRKNTWFKIAPAITLTSLSGVFANANLSILFSSHVDIIQLEKSLRLQQLFIPKDNAALNNINYLGDINNAHILNPKDLRSRNIFKICNTSDEKSIKLKGRIKRKLIKNCVRNITDVGILPSTMSILNQCPSNSSRLCLNMLGDKVPGYSIKIKIPFEENVIIHQKNSKLKIARIITDATAKDVLQISIDVINESLVAKTYSIYVSNCGVPWAVAKSNVMKNLLPYVGETITFFFPLLIDTQQKRRKFNCDVVAKVSEMKTNTHWAQQSKPVTYSSKNKLDHAGIEKVIVIALRTLAVETERRCFCIWECKCHCTAKLETHVNFNNCQKMEYDEKRKAGMLLNCSYDENLESDSCITAFSDGKDFRENGIDGIFFLIKNACILLLIMLLLGLLKALFGRFCSSTIDRCGFDYVHPGKEYDESSCWRRFFINIIFFILLPFSFWCKCFTAFDLDLLAASMEWQCANDVCNPVLSGNKNRYNRNKQFCSENLDEKEDTILSQYVGCPSKSNHDLSNCINYRTRLSAGENSCGTENHLNIVQRAIYDKFSDEIENNEVDEEENTKYVLQTLTESRESLKQLLQSSSSTEFNGMEYINDKLRQAAQFVESLKEARIVYRTLDRPIGNVQNIPYGITYCLQGYFLPSSEAKYEFVSYHPLVQYYGISRDGTFNEALHPPVLLCSKQFSRVYNNILDVLCAKDLYIHPPSCVLCINVASLECVAPSLMDLACNKSFIT